MNNKPLVSVLMPAYNSERFIMEAVNSILIQTFSNFELIIIDDGSTDNTRKILNNITDKRVKIYFNEKNMGIPYTRNRALDLANGEYIALLDSDDIAIPERLERQIKFFNNNPDCVIVGGQVAIIDQNSRLIKKLKVRNIDSKYIHSSLLFICPLHNTTLMAKSFLFKKFKYNEEYHISSDHYLLTNIYLEGYKLYNINEILVFQREHNNRSTVKNIAFNMQIRKKVIAYQLTKLNIDFGEDDLIKHLYLNGKYKKCCKINIDLNYIKWTKRWLVTLIDANERYKLYPVREFREIIKYRWYKLLTRIERKHLSYEIVKHLLYNNLTFLALFSFSGYVLDYYLNCVKFRIKLNDIYKNSLLNIGG